MDRRSLLFTEWLAEWNTSICWCSTHSKMPNFIFIAPEIFIFGFRNKTRHHLSVYPVPNTFLTLWGKWSLSAFWVSYCLCRLACTRSHAQTVGKSTSDKSEDHFTEDIKNITDLVNTVPQTQPLHNTSKIMDIRPAPRKKLWKPYTSVRKENL